MLPVVSSISRAVKAAESEEDSEMYAESMEHKDAETERNDDSDITVNTCPQQYVYNDSIQILEELAEEQVSEVSDSDQSLSEEAYSSLSDHCPSPTRLGKSDIIHYLRQKLNVMTTKYSRLKTQNKYLKKQSQVSPIKVPEQSGQILELAEKKYIKQWATILPKMTAMKESRFIGMSQEFVLEELDFEQSDYEVIFGGKGRLVQPRPDYKPKSSIIIREFPTWRDIRDVFRKHGLEEIVTVNVWKNKQCRQQREAKVDALTVRYNKPKKVLHLKFKCERLWMD